MSTLVLGFGAQVSLQGLERWSSVRHLLSSPPFASLLRQLWKAHKYSAMVDGCKTRGGLQDAFRPLMALGYGLPDWHLAENCDVFSVRYPILVQNIARFLGNLRVGAHYFEGHVSL